MWADPDAVEAKAAEWTKAQLECRVTGNHDWNSSMTLLSRLPNGTLRVRQQCGRGCGVGRKNYMAVTGHLIGKWQRDESSPQAKTYPMVDKAGKRLGRVDADGQARLRLMLYAGLHVADIPVEEETS